MATLGLHVARPYINRTIGPRPTSPVSLSLPPKMQASTNQPSTPSTTVAKSPLMCSSEPQRDVPAPRLANLSIAHHDNNSNPPFMMEDDVEEIECSCRATFSEDIASTYSEKQTGIKLHLCICHIQSTPFRRTTDTHPFI